MLRLQYFDTDIFNKKMYLFIEVEYTTNGPSGLTNDDSHIDRIWKDAYTTGLHSINA